MIHNLQKEVKEVKRCRIICNNTSYDFYIDIGNVPKLKKIIRQNGMKYFLHNEEIPYYVDAFIFADTLTEFKKYKSILKEIEE